MTPVQMRDYFDKLGIKNELEPTVADMISLHHAQHRTLPFENFDVYVGQGIKLDIDAIFEKLIRHQRGGYCFEVNGLLLRVMESLGFTVRPLLARVHLSGEPSGRSHQVTLATIDDQQWIVDAGFGANTPRAPLELTLHREQCIDHQCFRFIEDERCGYLLQVKQQDWASLYSLDMTYVCRGDILYGNHFTSTSPETHFTNSLIAAKPIEGGIITLLDSTLKIRMGNEEAQEVELTKADLAENVERHFGIQLEASQLGSIIAKLGW